MKRTIIEIKDITKAIPKYKVWYKYYDDIFISVIFTNNSRKSHLRIKNYNNNIKNKSDNKMCFWHSNWQYSKIENLYGLSKTGNKTYEVTENYKGEKHRIDSVVGSIAIEFQHTLSVSLNEMNSRYIAHKALNYLPYLVLDFSKFKAKDSLFKIRSFSTKYIDYHINYSPEKISSFLKKFKKWINTEYYRNGNLFLDFSDTMVRFTPKLKKEYVIISKEKFLNNLQNLEENIIEEFKTEKKLEEQKKKEREAEEQEWIKQRKLNYKQLIKNNKLELETENSYYFYRKCLTHPEIKKIVSKQKNIEYVKYDTFRKLKNNILEKSHIYSFFQSAGSKPILEIQYITHSNKIEKEYKYLFAKILIIQKYRKGIIVLEFLSETGNKIRKVSKKLELARGFLHSITHPAKFEYDENEKLISKEYFLFNHKVNKQVFQDLSNYFEIGYYFDNDLEMKYRKMIDKICSNDEYKLIEGFIQNYISEYSLEEYYNDRNEWQPLSAKNEW